MGFLSVSAAVIREDGGREFVEGDTQPGAATYKGYG